MYRSSSRIYLLDERTWKIISWQCMKYEQDVGQFGYELSGQWQCTVTCKKVVNIIERYGY